MSKHVLWSELNVQPQANSCLLLTHDAGQVAWLPNGVTGDIGFYRMVGTGSGIVHTHQHTSCSLTAPLASRSRMAWAGFQLCVRALGFNSVSKTAIIYLNLIEKKFLIEVRIKRRKEEVQL